MEQKKPSLEDLQRAFSVTSLEPEIPPDTLVSYAAGLATPVESDLVETMLAVDPSLSELIGLLREELAKVNEPLPSVPKAAVEVKKSGWLPTWFSLASTILAVGACGLLAFTFLDRSRLLQDVQTKERTVATAIDASRKNVELLQQKINSMDLQLKSSNADKQQLTAKLERAHNLLDRELAAQSSLTATPNGVESLVAHALTHGLSMPPSLADISMTERGSADLDVEMSPSRTSVRMPVELSWSGPKTGDYHVELVQDGTQVWNARVAEAVATPPRGLLKPGAVYSWRIASGANRSAWAGFRICTESDAIRANRIDKDREMGPLEKGVAYAALGLVADAEHQFKLLHSSHPALAQRLTTQLEQFRK